jgi:hypothetical protein
MAVAVAMAEWNPPCEAMIELDEGAAASSVWPQLDPPKISAKLYCAPDFWVACALAAWFRRNSAAF